MRRIHIYTLGIVSLLAMGVSACSPAETQLATTTAPEPTAMPTVEIEPTQIPAAEFEKDLFELDLSNFDDPTNIDNEWLPMTIGMQTVLEGVTEEAGLIVPHRIIFSVTDLTKEIQGIRTVVAYIVDVSKDEVVEKEIAFYAQDNDGNVWYFGEYPEVYEFGKLVEAPAWIVGYKGAKAGMKMEANPQPGKSYSQGWGPAVNWTDRGQVAQMGVQTCVPFDCYENVMIIEEFSREESGAYQLKYYAQGVGNMQVGWRGEDASRETLEMIEHRMLSAEEMDEIRAEVHEMESRAYDNSKEVYALTSPVE